MIDSEWITEAQTIKTATFNIIRLKFKEKWPCRPKLINPNFCQLSTNVSAALESPMSIPEIKVFVWDCGG